MKQHPYKYLFKEDIDYPYSKSLELTYNDVTCLIDIFMPNNHRYNPKHIYDHILPFSKTLTGLTSDKFYTVINKFNDWFSCLVDVWDINADKNYLRDVVSIYYDKEGIKGLGLDAEHKAIDKTFQYIY